MARLAPVSTWNEPSRSHPDAEVPSISNDVTASESLAELVTEHQATLA